MTVLLSHVRRPVAPFLLVLTLVLGLCGGVATIGAAPADAAVSASVAKKALSYAASKRGTLYLYGGAGPTRFDCSGLTKWAYARAGRRLPRTAAQQYSATLRVPPTSARPGDLVFFITRGRVYHMGMYVGAGRILHSPRTGSRVKVSVIWTTAVAYGRVR